MSTSTENPTPIADSVDAHRIVLAPLLGSFATIAKALHLENAADKLLDAQIGELDAAKLRFTAPLLVMVLDDLIPTAEVMIDLMKRLRAAAWLHSPTPPPWESTSQAEEKKNPGT